MPLTFQNRAEAFEAKFAFDENLRFRITARRDKLFARWLATQERLSETAYQGLLKTIMAVPDGDGHDEALLVLVQSAPARLHGNALSADALRAALASSHNEAKAQLFGEMNNGATA